MDIQQHFKILNLKPDASADEVKSAYKDSVKKWHPDRFNNDPVKQELAEEKIKKINLAYDRIKTFLASRPEPNFKAAPIPKKPTSAEAPKPGGKPAKKTSSFDDIWLNISETVRNILNSESFKSFISGKHRAGLHSQAIPGNKDPQKPKKFEDILKERMASGGRAERMRQAKKRRQAYMLRQTRAVPRQEGHKTDRISPISKIRPVNRVERIGGDS